jgi:hypothetical protein
MARLDLGFHSTLRLALFKTLHGQSQFAAGREKPKHNEPKKKKEIQMCPASLVSLEDLMHATGLG